MRECEFTSLDDYYTASICLILLSSMLFVILLGTLYKMIRLKSSFKKDAHEIKTSFLSQSNTKSEFSNNNT